YADLHIHSKYSRATSRDMTIPVIAQWARLKGIGLAATGDFTHPLWFEHLRETLAPSKGGLYLHEDIFFMLSAEVSCIYSQKDKNYRIHHILYAPSMEEAEEISAFLSHYGKMMSDGRPIISLDSKTLVKKLRQISPQAFLVPAHIWTPWFSLFGSNSGFNKIEECFGDALEYIYALETGLSSDPSMNRLCSKLDSFLLLSNSDAHSPSNLGRESNIFELNEEDWSFASIRKIISDKNLEKFRGTVEFFPEEGKYHYDGHRNCKVSLHPKETRKKHGKCPVCGKALTIGVLNRVYKLSDRKEGETCPSPSSPSMSLIPLAEILSEIRGTEKNSKKVKDEYMKMVYALKNEYHILIEASEKELCSYDEQTGLAILQMRRGEVEKIPGYDGLFGKLSIRQENSARAPRQSLLF
ncbi:MAG TPA: endonuclease Q family protein, partial [bacterium]|nr:endonuclease Q family protein [bacterium]